MTSPILIDFAPQRPRPPLASIALFLVAAAACTAALLDYHSVGAEVEELARQNQEARHQLDDLKRRYAPPPQADLAPEVIAAANRAITQLNLPWEDLFEIFESRTLPTVALLALEPDSRKGLVKITAEAKGPEDMANFLELLVAEPRFAEVALAKHEINQKDANRPVRFVVEARWREKE